MNAMKASGNPIIRNKFTADPTAIVHDGKVFLYVGHDAAAAGIEEYVMNEWLCYSSTDLISWEEHPSPLRPNDFGWSAGGAYATKVTRKGNQFYWFVSTRYNRGGTAIGVAISSTPHAGYKDAIGRPLVTPDMLPSTQNVKANLDPTVWIEGNTPYLFWGNKTCYFARLNANMTEVISDIKMLDLTDFAEGAHIHKRNDWYYLSYGQGMPERVAYAMSHNIEGPWEEKGILNELVYNCETNRPCIIDLGDRSYFFYHNGALPGGGSHRRSVCVDELHYESDGTIKKVEMTSKGIL
jgi:beta-xylosidase